MGEERVQTVNGQLLNRPAHGGAAKKLLYAALLAVVLLLSIPSYAYADTHQVLSAKAFRNLLEEDDFCVIFHYKITHDIAPAYPANRYYHFRLMSPDGLTQLGATAPYPYFDNGYGEGAAAFYFSAAEFTALGLVWEDSYIVRIEGNPELHPAPPVVTYALGISDYSQLLTQAENRTLLGNYVLDIADSLEIDWAVALVYSSELGHILNSTGESYFRGTIPGIQYMAPQIFSVQINVPAPTPRAWGTGQADAYKARFSGTWVGDALDGASGLFGGVDWSVVTGMGLLLFVLALFGLSQWKFQTTLPGFAGGVIIMLGGFVMGFVSPGILGVTVLLCAMYIGYVLVFRSG